MDRRKLKFTLCNGKLKAKMKKESPVFDRSVAHLMTSKPPREKLVFNFSTSFASGYRQRT